MEGFFYSQDFGNLLSVGNVWIFSGEFWCRHEP